MRADFDFFLEMFMAVRKIFLALFAVIKDGFPHISDHIPFQMTATIQTIQDLLLAFGAGNGCFVVARVDRCAVPFFQER